MSLLLGILHNQLWLASAIVTLQSHQMVSLRRTLYSVGNRRGTEGYISGNSVVESDDKRMANRTRTSVSAPLSAKVESISEQIFL